MHQRGQQRACTLLLSGGIDSATMAAVLLTRMTWHVTALFIDFGQRARRPEREASRQIAEYYNIGWVERRMQGGPTLPVTEVAGRNDLLIAVGATISSDAVAIGTHSGTPYADSSPGHIEAWQRLFDVQYHGRRRLLAPFAHMTKQQVVALAVDRKVPLDMTRSCDDADGPCDRCPSCDDRRNALAGA